MDEFEISSTLAFLPLSLYVFALGLGPVLGGPLSEVAGRQAVSALAVILGGLFALGSGLAHTFAGLCVMRFLSGFFYGPSLAVGSGVLQETYLPIERGPPGALYVCKHISETVSFLCGTNFKYQYLRRVNKSP